MAMKSTHDLIFPRCICAIRQISQLNVATNSGDHIASSPMATVPKAPPGSFNILYFATATSYTKRSYDTLAAPLPVTELFEKLDEMYPGMKAKVLESCALTVNLDYVDLDEESEKGSSALVIKEGDDAAIIPPVSSG